MSFDRKLVHVALVEAGVVVYEAAEQYQAACTVVLDVIAEAREALSTSEFAKWATSVFGTGGARKADGYVAGSWPDALRADGRLMQRSATKEDTKDSAANRVNTFVSDCRAIVRACIDDASFEYGESFRATYKKARGSDEPATGEKATKKDKSAEAPSAAVVVDLKAFKVFAESNLPAAIEMIEQIMLKRKDTIRAATLSAIRNQLVANSK